MGNDYKSLIRISSPLLNGWRTMVLMGSDFRGSSSTATGWRAA